MRPSRFPIFRLLPLFAAVLLISCDRHPVSPPTPVTAAADTHPGEIAWFEGTVEEAFAAAREQGKPVFLYWGAEWCPPCHAIAATVFRSREFIERSRQFVAVYLDGDQANAQAAGERFDVVGYPTMVVFAPNGGELTRIPGGIDIQAYANVLDLSLDSDGSVPNALRSFLANERVLDEADCQRLTYYSWAQDTQIFAEREGHDVFRKLYEACPASLITERSILFANYLEYLAQAVSSGVSKVELDSTRVDEAIRRYSEILDDPTLARANVFTLIFSGSKIITAITDTRSPSRTSLIDKSWAALNRIAADETIYKRERIYSAIGKIDLERIDDEEAELSGNLRNEIMRLASWADESTPDVYERQPIINAASGLLEYAGMPEIAKPMLLAELNRSKQPYYFMLSLADIEQTAGNYPEALDWLRKAYETSRGSATRFQWGSYYVTGLIEMSPDNSELIHKTTVEVIKELEGGAGFHQRPKSQLKKLESKLKEWNEGTRNANTLERIRNDVLLICNRFADQKDATSSCRSFLGTV